MTTVLEVEKMIKDVTGEYVVSPDWTVFMKIWDVVNNNPLKY